MADMYEDIASLIKEMGIHKLWVKIAIIKNKFQLTLGEMLDAYERQIMQDVTFILF